jgi:hypothetical protein
VQMAVTKASQHDLYPSQEYRTHWKVH